MVAHLFVFRGWGSFLVFFFFWGGGGEEFCLVLFCGILSTKESAMITLVNSELGAVARHLKIQQGKGRKPWGPSVYVNVCISVFSSFFFFFFLTDTCHLASELCEYWVYGFSSSPSSSSLLS